jgi:hypothetical protein
MSIVERARWRRMRRIRTATFSDDANRLLDLLLKQTRIETPH